MQPLINSPSLANCDLLDLEKDTRELVRAGVTFFHIDIMDGHYVPNLCYPIRLISDLKRKYPDVTMDVHLMVTDPGQYVDRLADAGAGYVSFHIDSTSFVIRTLNACKVKGMKCGVVINPSQRIDMLTPYLDLVDMVTLMTVEPGFSGQKFMSSSLSRVQELSDLRKKTGCSFLINIDGGIDYPNIRPCVRRGANVFVTGIYTVFKQDDGIFAACKRFEKEMHDGLSEEKV